MLRLAADENLNNDIVRALLRRRRELDLVRVQDAGLSGATDDIVLGWAAREGRILLTHDVSTVTRHAYERVARGEPMPGVFEVSPHAAIGEIVDDILLILDTSRDREWDGQVRYLPLR